MTLPKIGAKGESMAVDLAFAVFIFLLIAGSITWVWSNKAAESEKQIHENEIQLMAERALDTLVRSSGQPAEWEKEEIDDINVIGLAKRSLVLDNEKVNWFLELVHPGELGQLDDINYAKLKQKLLIGANDYYFRLVDPATSPVVIVENEDGKFIEIGKKPGDSLLQTTFRRPVVFAYYREGEDEPGEKSQHGAVAELTLSIS